jgi:hypothetical protein
MVFFGVRKRGVALLTPRNLFRRNLLFTELKNESRNFDAGTVVIKKGNNL